MIKNFKMMIFKYIKSEKSAKKWRIAKILYYLYLYTFNIDYKFVSTSMMIVISLWAFIPDFCCHNNHYNNKAYARGKPNYYFLPKGVHCSTKSILLQVLRLLPRYFASQFSCSKANSAKDDKKLRHRRACTYSCM